MVKLKKISISFDCRTTHIYVTTSTRLDDKYREERNLVNDRWLQDLSGSKSNTTECKKCLSETRKNCLLLTAKREITRL